MRAFFRFFGVISLVFLVGGCRGGRYDLTKSQLKPDFHGSGKVAIGVQDKRPFILDGTKPSTFIGIHRNGVGSPGDAGTRSGKTLAEDVATIVASSFGKAGFEARQFSLSPNDHPESSCNGLTSSAHDRIVVLTLNKFRSDSWVEAELQWAITMRIYDGQCKRLAEKDSTGTEQGLKRNYAGALSASQTQKAIATKLSAILAELINAPECKRAMLGQDFSSQGGSSPLPE